MTIAVASLQAQPTYQSELVPTTGSNVGMTTVILNSGMMHPATVLVVSSVNTVE